MFGETIEEKKGEIHPAIIHLLDLVACFKIGGRICTLDRSYKLITEIAKQVVKHVLEGVQDFLERV